MTPDIIAHYLVAIAVIAVFLIPADWDRLADCQKASRIDALREIAKRIERRAAFAARYGCEVKA